jgi:hypothetical protein
MPRPQRPIDDRTPARRIKAIEDRLDALETGNRSGYTTVVGDLVLGPGSSLIARDTDGSVLFKVGPLSYGGVAAPLGMLVYRADATLALAVEGATNQFVAIRDRTGNIVVSDDSFSGQGLARPWIPVPFFDETTSTASTTFVTTGSARLYKQHPNVRLEYLHTTGASPGELQVVVVDAGGASTVLYTDTLTASTAARWISTPNMPMPGNFGDRLELKLQHRITSGSTAITARIMSIWATQS